METKIESRKLKEKICVVVIIAEHFFLQIAQLSKKMNVTILLIHSQSGNLPNTLGMYFGLVT